MPKPDTIMIDDTKYVREDFALTQTQELNGLTRCLIRSYAAGVFIGYIEERKSELNGVNVTLLQAKRVHYWEGACSLTQLALEGTKKPDKCRITNAIPSQFIANVVEIIPLTLDASQNLDEVSSWKQ